MYYAIFGNATLMVANSMLRPWSPEFLTSLLSQPEQSGILLRLAVGLFQSYVAYSFLENSILYLTCFLTTVASILDILSAYAVNFVISRSEWLIQVFNCCRIQLETGRRLTDTKQLLMILRLYRCLYLQVNEFSRTFVAAYGSIHLGLIVLTIFCSYGSIRFNGLLALGCAWIFTVCLVIVIVVVTALSTVNRKSRRTLESMEKAVTNLAVGSRQPKRGMLWREMRNMQELKVTLGSVFYYDKPLLLTTFEILLQNATNLLLVK